jgi:hypothetical protein
MQKLDSGAPSDVSTTNAEFNLPTIHRTSCADYCNAARQARHNEFWWYFNGLAPYRGFSKPFHDGAGRWWYRVKPAFAWPVDFFQPLSVEPSGRGFRRLLGWQYPVAEGRHNSTVHMNVILDLTGYAMSSVEDSKRRAIRKGMRALEVVALKPDELASASAAHEVWKSHTQRTGWNSALSLDRFAASWVELGQWPGTTVLAARAKGGPICAWLIARWIDDAVYFDTLASHTDRLEDRPNDLIAFSCLKAAAEQGAKRAHYSLKSNIPSLEAFKQSLGFEAKAFPAHLRLRYPVRIGLHLLRPRLYARLRGEASADSIPPTNPTSS